MEVAHRVRQGNAVRKQARDVTDIFRDSISAFEAEPTWRYLPTALSRSQMSRSGQFTSFYEGP